MRSRIMPFLGYQSPVFKNYVFFLETMTRFGSVTTAVKLAVMLTLNDLIITSREWILAVET